ncbi:MAG: hypothetical protein ACTSYD_02315 [Candidatus Heimdallarchaeaceae archaeon]
MKLTGKLTKYQQIALELIDKEILKLETELAELRAVKKRVLKGEPKLKKEFER